MARQRVCRPKELGGLGLLDLNCQGLALRLRWEWLRRTDSSRPWHGLPMAKDPQVHAAFDSLVHWKLGDGNKVLFWKDRWMGDKDMKTVQSLESRTTPFQEREDDEDIPTMDTTPPTINGPITRSRAMQIHYQVNANLSLSFDLQNMVVPSLPLLLVELRCDIEEGQTHFSPCKTMFYGEETKLGIHEE